MTSRLRMILPPDSIMVVFAVIFLCQEAPVRWLEWRVGAIGALDFPHPGTMLIVCAALAYGAYRVLAFHPFVRPAYRRWLERTPWTSTKPLPLGPVAIVYEDALVLGILTALAASQPSLSPVAVVVVALVGYLVPLTVTFFFTGEAAWGYALAFALGLVVRLSGSPLWCLATAGVLAALSQIGLSRALARFPWPITMPDVHAQDLNKSMGEVFKASPQTCGWPFDQLRPDLRRDRWLDRRDAILIALLAGWWLSALVSPIVDVRAREGFLAIILIHTAFALPIIRLVVYLGASYRPPVSAWWRIRHFRWIIPGFDQVLITPLCSLFACGAIPYALWLHGTSIEVYAPMTLAVALAIILAGGPSLQRWHLTGKHRIQPSVSVQRTKELIQVG